MLPPFFQLWGPPPLGRELPVIAGSEPSCAVPAPNLACPLCVLTTSLPLSCTCASSQLLWPPYILSKPFGFPGFNGSKSFTLLPNSNIAGHAPSHAMGVFLYCNFACNTLSQSGLPSGLVLSSNVVLVNFTPVSILRLPCGL